MKLLFVIVASLTLSASACHASHVDDRAGAPDASSAVVDSGVIENADAGVDASKRADIEDAGAYAGMASIAGGTFDMGYNGHTVSVASFQLDVTEVTVDAYAACVAAGKCSGDVRTQFDSKKNEDGGAGACNFGVPGRGNDPINCVDWNQALTFCRAHGKRLPTEEEWEWAARGENEGRTYPWGNSDDVHACISDERNRSGTCPVGSFPEGDARGGVHDMAGNVYEWTSTVWAASDRVTRGGSWNSNEVSMLRASYRFAAGVAPKDRNDETGFRCAR